MGNDNKAFLRGRARAGAALFSLVMFSAMAGLAQPVQAEELSRTDFVLGTVCTVRLMEGGSAETLKEVFARLRTIEDRMSANKDGTEIALVNAQAGKAPVKVSPDTFFVISKALEYAQRTAGEFDPTVGPLVKLWNIGSGDEKVPSQKQIDAARALIDWRQVVMDSSAQTVFLKKPGMRLDLGAIAKGYAADEIAQILSAHKVKAGIVDLGGNILAFGTKKDKSLWRIGIQDPESERGEYLGIVTGSQMTVVTSGVYERYFIENGTRYHHILSTRTGWPADNGLISVSIVAKKSIDADALSTSLFILGVEKGLALLRNFPDTYAIFIDRDHKVYLSPGAGKIFKLISKEYRLSD